MNELKCGVCCTFTSPDCVDFVEGDYYELRKLTKLPHVIDGDYLVSLEVWVDESNFVEHKKVVAMFDISHLRA